MRIKEETYLFPTSTQLMKIIKKDWFITNSPLIRELKIVEMIVQLFATKVFTKDEIILTVRSAILIKKDEISNEEFKLIEAAFINVLQNYADRTSNWETYWIYPSKLFFMHAKL